MYQQDAGEHHEHNTTAIDYVAMWQQAAKLAVERWLVENMGMLSGWCLDVQRRYKLSDVWEDLRNDAVIEAYRYGIQFNPTVGGDFDHYLSSYLKRYPSRHDVVKRYTKNRGHGEAIEYGGKSYEYMDSADDTIINWVDGSTKGMYTEDLTNHDQPSAVSLIQELHPAEQMYLQLKYMAKLNNCEMARIIGTTECTVRYQIKRILGKLKIKGE